MTTDKTLTAIEDSSDFFEEQQHAQAQAQADKNEQLLDELVEEWRKYPDGNPQIKFIGFGSIQ